MIPPKSNQSAPAWVLLPLRLFLGITFIYAGIQKLIDPQYFNPSTPGYIGKQIIGFAAASPLHGFLLHVVAPHALIFGFLVAYGEIAIGLGTLAGLLLRPAAFFGLLLNIIFFLSATWHVYPYFYGADIVFIFCWLTLLLNGPAHTGLPTLDQAIVPGVIQHASSKRWPALARLLRIISGIDAAPAEQPALSQNTRSGQYRTAPLKQRKSVSRAREARRNFLLGMITGGTGIAGMAGFLYLLDTVSHSSEELTQTPVEPLSATPRTTETAGTSATASSTAITRVSALPPNNAVTFTIPSNGDPGILIHLTSGQFVAYDALCTHAGCQVDYDSGSKLLLCPCHGAAFDPAKDGAAVQLPATQPLAPVAIRVDSATGAILLASS
jgi:thiosulfate dehydrogenase [quinone] large subunit